MKRVAAALLALACFAPPVAAEEPRYRLPTNGSWADGEVDVIVVPPLHGPLVNGHGPLGGGGSEEIGLSNSYVRATKKSIAQYTRVVRKFGPRWLAKELKITTYVVGRDEIPERVRNDAEAIIVFNEHQTFILGVTFSINFTGAPDCLISNSMAWTASYSFTDMYNVNLHEFGHCLGLGHFEGPQKDPIFLHENMTPTYNHNVGVPGTHKHCISNFDVKVLSLSFAPAVGRNPSADAVTGGRADYRTYGCKG